jgi:hypothetical protein
MALHSYNSEFAHYGLIEAVLIQHFQFWIKRNKVKNSNGYDEHTWTYSSVAKLHDQFFSYLTPRRIQLALERLIAKGVLLKGNYNKTGYDRTNWYCFADEKKFLSQPIEKETSAPIQRSRLMDSTPTLNRFTPAVTPIPDINTDIGTDDDDVAIATANKIITMKKPPAAIDERRRKFKADIDSFRFGNSNLYPISVYEKFYNHWIELSQNGTVMRFEEQRWFSIEIRLQRFWDTISIKDRDKFWCIHFDWMREWKSDCEKKGIKAIIAHASRSTQPELFKQQRYTS